MQECDKSDTLFGGSVITIFVQQIITGKWKENCYVIHKTNQDTLIIDPGSEAKCIIEYIEGKQLNIIAILNTHAHYDHIGAVKILKTKFSVPFYLHSKDFKLLKYANLYINLFDGDDHISTPNVDFYINQVKTPICLGDFSIQVLFTPGHTQGSVCFLIEDCLFAGDTFFKGKIGRVDLPGGDKEALCNSLKNLSMLPPKIKIYPGHGGTSTILEEMQKNLELLEAIQ